MANNSQIKALINEKITTNGTGAITGSELNNVLTQMVLLVGQGRAFAGIATPSGTPSTYDRNVFWLATAEGTYTNFGGLTIPEGLSVILYNEVEGVGSYSFNTLIEIDDAPTSGSDNLVSSGAIHAAIQTAIQAVEQGATEIYDVSGHHSGASYSTLAAALALVPQVLQKGGISVKYIDSTSGEYVQYRLLATSWSTNSSDWEKAGTALLYNGTGQNTDGAMTQKAVTDTIEEVGKYEILSEYVKLVTDANHKIIYGIKANGDFYFGAGCPPQVKDYIQSKIAEIQLDEYDDIVDFVNGLEQGDLTLQQLLNEKVDEVSGLSLIDSEYASCQDVISNQDWMQATTDSNGRVLEGIKANGEKYIGKFDSDTEQTIKEIINVQSSSVISIPLIDENFTSPVPCTITGTKGDENAKYEFSLDLKSAYNIRFKFRVTENLINQNKTAAIAKLNDTSIATAIGVSLSQQTSTATYNGETKTNYWPCLIGGMRLNGGSVSVNSNNKHIGRLAFSVKYIGSESTATIENTGTALVIKIGSATHTFAYTTYPTVSELYEAVKLINDIEVNYKNLENKNSNELAVFSESKLKTTMYTGINGTSGAPIVEYVDAAEFMIPYAVDDTWYNVEIVKIGDTIYSSCGGFLKTYTITVGDSSTLTLGGDCGVLFKELQIVCDSPLDAEIVDGNLISSVNPYIIVYEGHGIDKVPSVEAETTENMNTTIDRLQFVFELLKKKGYVPVSIHDIAEYYNGNRNLPKRCYTLIFDDLRFDNVLDIDNRSVFTSFGVKPALAIISDRMGNSSEYPIMHNGVAISADKAVEISKMHNFDLVSHTKNHRANDAVKPSEMIGKLIDDNYYGELYGVNSEILVFPYGRTNPYLFWAMKWLGYKLGVNVWSENYAHKDNFSRLKYNLVRYEIGMREDMDTIIELMR